MIGFVSGGMAYQAFLEAGKEHGWFLADNRPFLETLLGTDIASKVPITGENKGIKKEEGSKEVGGSERDKERKIKEDKEAKVVEIIEDEEEDIVPPKRRPVQYVYGATDDTAYDNEEMEVRYLFSPQFLFVLIFNLLLIFI